MTGEVIKSFLVGLGFDVDDTSLSKFNKSIASAALRVTALYGAVNTAVTGIVYGISEISDGFEKMGYEYRIIAPAINKALVLRNELLKAYSAAGINITKVIQSSVKLNLSLTKTKFAFEAIYRSVGSRFFGLITKQSDILRQKLYANMPKIQNAMERFVKFIFKAFEAITALGSRVWSILEIVYDFFVKLDKATDGWSTIIVALIAAWKLLNLSFLATPFGMILAGLVGILALYDDFKTWQEGGESLFDWAKFLPVIQTFEASISSLVGVWRSMVDVVGEVFIAFYRLFHSDYQGFFDGLADAGKAVVAVLTNLFDSLKNNFDFIGAIAKFGGGQLGNLFGAQPVSGAVQNSQSNQHVNQQTTINVQSSADANSVGKSVANEQGRVNFDMTRNMKGSVR